MRNMSITTRFMNAIINQLRSLRIELKEWKFALEPDEHGVAVDITVKLKIKPRKQGR